MLWDVDYDSTDTMMKDVGVSLLMPDGKKTNGRHSVKSQSNATQPAQSHVSSSSLCSEKKHPLLFSSIPPWKMFTCLQNFR